MSTATITAVSLGAKQVAQAIQQGTSAIVTIMHEETIDHELGVIYPAKSQCIDNPEGLKNLRDLLLKLYPLEGCS